MVSGRTMVRFKVTNKETQEKVLVGEVEAKQPISAYKFASQQQGMGMGLYGSSPVAREVWNRVDRPFKGNFGKSFSLLFLQPTNSIAGFVFTNILRNNSGEFTVHLSQLRGKSIRQNYIMRRTNVFAGSRLCTCYEPMSQGEQTE